MQEKIEQDLKTALLAGDRAKVETLRGIKNALQYEAVAQNTRENGLNDEQILKVLSRESKKRAEAAELYQKGGSKERAEAELNEKAVIDGYLPEQVGEDEIAKIVDEEVSKLQNPQVSDMGKVIGAVRSRLGASADGATIAKLVKEKLST